MQGSFFAVSDSPHDRIGNALLGWPKESSSIMRTDPFRGEAGGLALPIDLAVLRSHVLDELMLLIGLALGLRQAIAVFEALTFGAQWSLAVNLGALAGIWVLWLSRRHTPFVFRAMGFLACLWISVTASVANFGPIDDSKGYFILLTLLSMLLLGGRAGWLSVALVGLTLGAIGAAAVGSVLVYDLDYARYASSPNIWMQHIVGYTLFAALSARTAARMIHSLDCSARALAARNRDLVQARDRAYRARSDAEHANRTKDRLMAMVSHELRSPLQALLSRTEALQRGAAPALHLVQGIHRNALRLLARVEDILDVARVTDGVFVARPAPCNAAAVVAECAHQVQPAAAAKGLSLRIWPRPPARQVLLDPQRLDQVVSNLLENAVKYTQQGGISVRTRLRRLRRDPRRACIAILVRDTGTGITQPDRDRLFLPFEQGQDQHRSAHGYGLGLTIARELVEAMGGRLRLHSRLGSGCRFSIGFPDLALATGDGATAHDEHDEPAALSTATEVGAVSEAGSGSPAPPRSASASDLPWLGALCGGWLERWQALDPDDAPAVARFADDLRVFAEHSGAGPLTRWARALAQTRDDPDPARRRRRLATLPELLPRPPPASSLAQLAALAELGLTSRIEQWCDRWDVDGGAHRDFAALVRTLAYNFDPVPLCALIEVAKERAAGSRCETREQDRTGAQ